MTPTSRPYILVDLEYTAWEGSWARKWSEPWEHREIIQIAALRIEGGPAVTETGWFDCLVKPKHNPLLSPYIVALTGIEQPALDAQGKSFSAALADFFAFCDGGQIPIFCYGYDDVLVIAENCRLNDLPPAIFPAGIYDIRPIFQRAGIDTRPYTSGTVYQAVGAEFDLAAHNALNDVRSLAVTIRQLIRLGRMAEDWASATGSGEF